jgi:hypothetical protein
MIDCFTLIDLRWKEGALVHISSKIPADMHVEEDGDPLITSLR